MYYLIVPVGLGSPCGSVCLQAEDLLPGCRPGAGHGHCLILGLRGEESPPMLACLDLAGFVPLWTFGLRVSGAHWLLFFQYVS